jgi:hypothetical protein
MEMRTIHGVFVWLNLSAAHQGRGQELEDLRDLKDKKQVVGLLSANDNLQELPLMPALRVWLVVFAGLKL